MLLRHLNYVMQYYRNWNETHRCVDDKYYINILLSSRGIRKLLGPSIYNLYLQGKENQFIRHDLARRVEFSVVGYRNSSMLPSGLKPGTLPTSLEYYSENSQIRTSTFQIYPKMFLATITEMTKQGNQEFNFISNINHKNPVRGPSDQCPHLNGV